MLHDLRDARFAESGGKAAALGRLLRAGIDVPPGVVVPVQEYRRHLLRHQLVPGRASPGEMRGAIERTRLADDLVHKLETRLLPGSGQVLDGPVAVRSSATTEDGTAASAAGQHDSFLRVQGSEAVCGAILRCWASLWSDRASAYRHQVAPESGTPPHMAVIVQQFVDADVSGVLFTGEERVLEAVRGWGDQLVGGDVTPDSWRRDERGLTASRAGGADARGLCLSDAQVHELDALGERVSRVLGAAVDIEWALTDDRFHVLQARPITAALPRNQPRGPLTIRSEPACSPEARAGIPASAGIASGTARVIRGPQDFRRVQPGDVLICRSTDPAWTPLFRVAGAVVTESGGVLSHAAIVARELGIPAVLAVPGARAGILEGSVVTVDGNEGTIREEASTGDGRSASRPAPGDG